MNEENDERVQHWKVDSLKMWMSKAATGWSKGSEYRNITLRSYWKMPKQDRLTFLFISSYWDVWLFTNFFYFEPSNLAIKKTLHFFWKSMESGYLYRM